MSEPNTPKDEKVSKKRHDLFSAIQSLKAHSKEYDFACRIVARDKKDIISGMDYESYPDETSDLPVFEGYQRMSWAHIFPTSRADEVNLRLHMLDAVLKSH